MPSRPLFKIAEEFLPRALKLIARGDLKASQARLRELPDATGSKPQAVWDLSTQDKTFWATLAGADKRLTELRRAIDEAAAEAAAREMSKDVQTTSKTGLVEGRCKTANRMISDALKTEKF